MPSGGPGIKAIYDELVAQGASTVQAIGIMANMINESGFNPEAVGDQGTSFGLVQQHGAYGYLVTGDPVADMKRQIAELKGLGGFAAASGVTPADAAGNFAANYERCVGCQPGGAQWQGRVGNAATVVGWFKSGKWPQSAGSPGGGSGGPTTSAQLTDFMGIPNPLAAPWELLNQAVGDVYKGISAPIRTGTSIADSFAQVAKGFTGLVGLFDRLLHVFEWIFNPTHWVRIIAFGAGLLFLIPGLYSLMKTGQGNYGDITLALGILLTMISGILFFIAFHNLPNDVRDLQTLLAWLSSGIRTGHAELAPAAAYGGGDLGTPGAPATSGGDFSGGPGANSFS